MRIFGPSYLSFMFVLAISDVSLRKKGLPLNLVVNLDVPDEVILARISDRWVHLPSGRVYNLSYNRPRVDGLDDETGEPLTKRPDDNPVRLRTVVKFIHLAKVYAWRSRKFSRVVCSNFTLRLRRFCNITVPLGLLRSHLPPARKQNLFR